ncbi:MAG: hypothetical protein PHT78_13090 [Desulfitobacteriaceae bacterium]|nr:hypothetical protein [Desulfitobacteriaceae bacterium]
MHENRHLSIAIVFILILNVVMLSRMGEINYQIRSLSQDYRQLQSDLDSISGNVAQFTREQSWITPVHVNEEKSKAGDSQGLAVLNWQIKDLPEGAEVNFHYCPPDSAEFKSIAAVSKGAGFFEVNVPVEIEIEPFWDIIVSKKTKGLGTVTSEHSVIPEQKVPAIGYYVSLKTDDGLKSSEVSYFDIAYLAHTKYEPIRGHVDIDDKQFHISIFENYPGGNNYQSVSLRIYDGNNTVVEKDLEIQDADNGDKQYFLSYDAGSENISHLVIKIKYENGKTFEKRVF